MPPRRKYRPIRLEGGEIDYRLRHNVEQQTVLQLLPEPKPCTRCRTPARTATARGRAVHLNCEGWLDVLTTEAIAKVLFGVAVDLGATVVEVS
ncbi:MAG: hypothetical protein ACT4NY_09215 [Pseudonocardiales bacterium]